MACWESFIELHVPFVTLGVLSFGFEQGLYASLITNEYFKEYYNEPTPAEIGIMVAILELGALFSSFLAAQAGDLLGRKKQLDTVPQYSLLVVSSNVFHLVFCGLVLQD